MCFQCVRFSTCVQKRLSKFTGACIKQTKIHKTNKHIKTTHLQKQTKLTKTREKKKQTNNSQFYENIGFLGFLVDLWDSET